MKQRRIKDSGLIDVPRDLRTNNVAEYMALGMGLKRALREGITHIKIFGDSQLVVRQIKGEYRAHKTHIKALLKEIKNILNNFDDFEIAWVKRDKNKEADRICKNQIKA